MQLFACICAYVLWVCLSISIDSQGHAVGWGVKLFTCLYQASGASA